MDARKTVISCTLTPVDEDVSKCEIRLEASLPSMLEAFENLSVAIIDYLENEHGKDLAEAAYAVLQKKVIDQTCLKESFDKVTKMTKAAQALSSIIGKTFEMPNKEGDA